MSVYTPSQFAMRDRVAIARLMHDYPFATLVTAATPEPFISHLPLLLVAAPEPHGTLIGHMARANPHWQHAAAGETIAIFHGPHAYVSPSWYAEPSKAVPTWNYAAIHAQGTLEVIYDAAETRGVLDALVQRFEGSRDSRGRAAPTREIRPLGGSEAAAAASVGGSSGPWQFAMSEPQRDALVGAIVAFRLHIHRLTAKFKLSQNRPADDQARVAAALDNEGYADAASVAAWMRAYAGGVAGG